jgi:hypothetical protein
MGWICHSHGGHHAMFGRWRGRARRYACLRLPPQNCKRRGPHVSLLRVSARRGNATLEPALGQVWLISGAKPVSIEARPTLPRWLPDGSAQRLRFSTGTSDWSVPAQAEPPGLITAGRRLRHLRHIGSAPHLPAAQKRQKPSEVSHRGIRSLLAESTRSMAMGL